MPLWRIECPEGVYSADDKREFAEQITDQYAEFGLPRFYVNVLFTELCKASFLIGGAPADDFVRISIDEIARSVPDGAQALWMKRVRKTVAPFTAERGLRWEVHIDDTPNDLWLLNGFFPPAQGSEDEKRWVLENQPSELTTR
ncbi:MAG TPA: tautomerase family protein [Solirubrobacteraceae bacterium]|nr:tautomerase family protein [Solirubrobacteraceae bacterium]